MISVSTILDAASCNGTHHKLAADALEHLNGSNQSDWGRFFRSRFGAYLSGAKAPDSQFKDFENHILYVRTSNWGGAPAAAKKWYDRTVVALANKNWNDAAYAAGVMSHYLADPMMPFHTAQTEVANNIHHALERSVSTSYRQMHRGIAEACAEIEIVTSTTENWLEEMLIAGANFANQDYQLLIEEYDFKAGVTDPYLGLNVFSRAQLCAHLAYAQKLQAYVLDRAIAEAGVKPPKVNLTPAVFTGLLKLPIKGLIRTLANVGEQKRVAAMYREYKNQGVVTETLTEELKAIRELVPIEQPIVLHEEPIVEPEAEPPVEEAPIVEEVAPIVVVEPEAEIEPEEIVKVEVKPEPEPIAHHHQPTTKKDDYQITNLVEIPSIGKRAASHLNKVGIHTVEDFLAANPDTIAEQIDRDYMDAETLHSWQHHADLKLAMPKLRSHDIQILVQSGFYSVYLVAESSAEELLFDVLPFVESEQGQQLIRPTDKPDFEEVESWIQLAQEAINPMIAGTHKQVSAR